VRVGASGSGSGGTLDASGGGTAGVGTGGAGGASHTDAAPAPAADDAGAPPVEDAGGAGKADRTPLSTGPGRIVLVAGGGNGGDGSPAVMASVPRPFGAVIDPVNGDLYIAEQTTGRIRRVDEKGMISTVLGNGASGPGGKLTLRQPHNLLFQPNTRHLFVGDTFAGRVIRMDAATGEAEVFAGAGSQVAPNLGRTYCLAFDAAGKRLYVTGGGVTIIDLETRAVSRVNTATPRVIAVDSKSNLYLGGGSSLRVADPMGRISEVMGSGGLAAPKHLSVDLEDNVIITDTESDTIRKWVASTKSVVKIARGGSGMLGGSPEMARLARPHGAFVDGQGRMYIADSFNNRVLRIEY
jgi:DNA-binding beta-propeller fold protein YncE